jgi:hypothetical protein
MLAALDTESAEDYREALALLNDTIEKRRRRALRGDTIIVTGTRVSSNSAITNNQVEGVDEGDIIKQIGNHLVVLRRGRLLSFDLGAAPGAIRAIDYIDAELPMESARHEDEYDAWYDEIVVHGDTIVLVGFSYDYGGAVIRRFRLDGEGRFQRLEATLIESGDYFDSSNYATRVIGNTLSLYLPRQFVDSSPELAVRPIVNGEILDPTSVFEDTAYGALQWSRYMLRHSVLFCPLDAPTFSCEATSILGPRASSYYVSVDYVYLWLSAGDWAYDFLDMSNGEIRRLATQMNEYEPDHDEISVLYRIPLDGSAPEVVQSRGSPANQFSFDETNSGVRVFVTEDDFSVPERYQSRLAWLDIPHELFSETLEPLPEAYRHEIDVVEEYVGDSRFIGQNLLYAEMVVETAPESDISWRLWIKRLDRDLPATMLPFDDARIERIEPLGPHAVVIAEYDDSLTASTIRLGDVATLATTMQLQHASQGDTRSHGFNYRFSDESGGVFALPVFDVPEGKDPRRADWYNGYSLAMHFVGVAPDLGTFTAGRLISDASISEPDDDCNISCYDWYGAARPFFIGDRVFALVDYELIEATGAPFTVTEIARANALSVLARQD